MTKKNEQQPHPLRIRSGADKGKMPHEIAADDFNVWLIEQGMNESDYWHNVENGKDFLGNIDKYGKPVATRNLTADQRGWALTDHRRHADSQENAKWFIDPAKPSRPIPSLFTMERNRLYNDQCMCDKPDLAVWGELYDGTTLMQCEECGEVLVPAEQTQAA